MGRNNSDFGTDLDNGDQLVGSIPFEADTTAAGEIARNMTLLAKLVAKRQDARSEGANARHQQDVSHEEANQPEGLAFAPVGLVLRDDGEVQIVASLAEAVECLTTQWPVRYGAAFEEALQACIDGIKGRISPEQVQSAFVNAANEAGIRIVP